MLLLRDIENLKVELIHVFEKCGNLSHPKILAISQALDEKIYLYQKSRGHSK